MEQEVKIAKLMIDLYCRGHHGNTENLCSECHELFDYIKKRLEKCPLQKNKPRCSKCTVHCYKPDRREQIKAVMTFRPSILTGES